MKGTLVVESVRISSVKAVALKSDNLDLGFGGG